MPSRIHGTPPTPRSNSTTVNDVVSALQRKLTSNHIETANINPPRRPSFSMDSILHPKKDKKHDDSKDDSRHSKRQGLGGRNSSKSKERNSTRSPKLNPSQPHGRFDMIIESPPLVLYGTPSNSSGALLSGRLRFLVTDPIGQGVRLRDISMILRAVSTTKKPIGKDCKDCSEKVEVLKKWDFFSEPRTFMAQQDNEFPYSFLFPGHLPASTNSQLASIQYSLFAMATTAHGEKLTLNHPLSVQRAIQPGPDKSSIRIFPPTNLTGRVQLPPVVYPIGVFPVTMSLSGVVEKKGESQTRWRLRKMTWRVEEHSKVISNPCGKHAHKVNEGKSILHQETRTLGNEELKGGWKSDFDTIGGEITMEFEASMTTKNGQKPNCGVDSATGIEVKHNLVIELIVAEEFCPSKNTSLVTPTGAARVLRMQFGLVVTERAGMGISWDEEMPPVYEDVPPSPPRYGGGEQAGPHWGATIEDYHGPLPDYEEYDSRATSSSQAEPSNIGLPMRDARPSTRRYNSDSGEGPSQPSAFARLHGLTNDELGAEPPQYALRRASEGHQGESQEDYAEGSTSAAQ